MVFACRTRLVLANFSYAKLPMVKDLEVAEELLLDSDLLCAIAGDPTAIESLRNRHGEVAADAAGLHTAGRRVLSRRRRLIAELRRQLDRGRPRPGHRGPAGDRQVTDHCQLDRHAFGPGESVCCSWPRSALPSTPCSTACVMSAWPTWCSTCMTAEAVKRKLAQDLKKSLDETSAARALDMSVEQEQLVHRRDALVARTEALHKKDRRWGISPSSCSAS